MSKSENPYTPDGCGTWTVTTGSTGPRLYLGRAPCRHLGVETGDTVRVEKDGENAIRVIVDDEE